MSAGYDEEVVIPTRLEFVGKEDIEENIRDLQKEIDKTINRNGKASDTTWNRLIPGTRQLKQLEGELRNVFNESEKIKESLNFKHTRLEESIKNLKAAYAQMYAPGADKFSNTSANRAIEEQRSLVKRLQEDYASSVTVAMGELDKLDKRWGNIVDTANKVIDELGNISRVSSETTESENRDLENINESLEDATSNLKEFSGAYSKLRDSLGHTTAGENELRVLEEISQKIDEIRAKYKAAGDDLQENLSKYYPPGTLDDIGKPFEELAEAQAKEEKALRDSYKWQILKAQAADGNAEAQKKVEAAARAEAREQERAEKAAQAKTREQIANIKEQESAMKKSNAQYYYALRAVKMLGFAMNSVNSTMDKFGKSALTTSKTLLTNFLKLTNIFTTFGGSLGKAVSKINSMNVGIKNAENHTYGVRNAQESVNFSLKKSISFLLRYGLGIRSIFVLTNKLRSAMASGMQNLATQWEEVNVQMSSVITSLFQMKNAIAAAVQPILTALAPALEHVANIVTDISYKIASFIAALTGSTAYVYKAKRAQQQYVDKSKDVKDTTEEQAEATQDTTSAMEDEEEEIKDLKKELSSLDKLNVLTTDDDKGKGKKSKEPKIKIPKAKDLKDDIGDIGDAVQDMFEKVPIDAAMADWADKFKKWLDKFFEPFKKAWDKEGKFVMDAWKKMLESVGKLLKDIARDFERVWLSDTMVQVWANILHIIGDIFLIIGYIADALREAWNHNENGYRFLMAIANILEIITRYIRKCADATVEWAKELSFVPLFDAIADVMEKQVVPAVEKVCNLLANLYIDVILPLSKIIIEEILPKLVKSFGNIVEAIGDIANGLDKAFRRNHNYQKIVDALGKTFNIIADTILEITESTKKWAKELKFYKLVDSITDALKRSEKPVQQICDLLKAIWNGIVLPMGKYLIEKVLPKVVDKSATILETIGNIVEKLKIAFEENDRGSRITENLKWMFERIGETIGKCVDKTKEWSEKIDFGPLVESIATFLEKSKEPLDFLCSTFEKFYNNVLLPFWQYIVEEGMPKLLEKLGEIEDKVDWDKLKEKVDAFLESLEPFLEKVWDTLVELLGDLGMALKDFVNSKEFEKIVDKIIEWMDDADPREMADGIERIVGTFVEVKAFIGLFSKIFIPALTTFMTAVNSLKAFGFISKVGKLSEKVGLLAGSTTEAAGAMGAAGGGAGSGLLGSISGALPVIALVLIAVGNLIFAYDGLNGVVERCEQMFSNFKETLKKVGEESKVPDSINNIKDSFKDLMDQIDNTSKALGIDDGLLHWLKELDKTVLEINCFGKLERDFENWTKIIEGTVAQISLFIESVTKGMSGAVEVISGGTKMITGYLTGDQGSILAGTYEMGEGFTKVFDSMGTAAEYGGQAVENAVRFRYPEIAMLMDSEFGQKVEGIFDAVKKKAENDMNDTAKATTDAMSVQIPESANSLENDFGVPVKNVLDGVKDTAVTDSSLIATEFNGLFTTELPQSSNNMQSSFSDPVKQNFDDLKTTAETDSKAISQAVDQSFNTDMTATAENAKTGFFDNLKESFNLLKYILIGDPIVYDIRDGVIQGFTDFITQTTQDTSGWVTDIADGFTELGTAIGNAIDGATKTIVDRFAEIKTGIETKCKEIIQSAGKKFSELKKEADNKLKSNALINNGKQFITGLDSGIKNKLSNVKSTVSKGINDIKKKFREGLKSNSLTSTGKNLINGLKSGLTSALSSALAAVSSLCAKIVAKAKQAFAVRSPSRVFAEIGENLVLGLDKGIEDNADSAGDAFEEMVPDDKVVAKFSDNFLNEMTGLTQNVNTLFNNMFTNIEDKLSSLSKMANLNELNRKLSSVNMPEVPAIVKGYRMPSNKEFSQGTNVNVDMTKLPQLMREAFIDALKETSSLQTDDETITINIDGNKVFQAVRSANTVYKKQHGVSAFA